MTFFKWNDFWVYQLPEWDNYDKDEIDSILETIKSIEIVNYLMAPEKDIWTIRYDNRIFIIANDLVYGCEIRASREEDLDRMTDLIKII